MKIDIAKRRRVMSRSLRLGHCICDPRKPCPCDVFTEHGLCPCAGERPEPAAAQTVRLTELVKNAGCASKIAPGDLEAILGRLPAVDDPNVLCGMPAGDDAGVYQLDQACLVQTVDVMTPCVDDARTFGRICAANAVSDIYAMGGTPRTALSIVAFPSETLSVQVLYEMMDGAMQTLAEAGVALIGGHSVKDEQIMLGFAVTGTVDPQRFTARGTAKVGDVLVLTKPLGAGVLAFARQIGRGHDTGQRQAEAAMMTLNRVAAQVMVHLSASACTDVTGFGLFGHLAGMVRHSHVTATIDADALPAFAGALELLADGVVPGAIERNMEYVGADLEAHSGVAPHHLHLGFDAQTSGGLLIAMPQARCAALLAQLAAGSVTGHVIGRITESSAGRIVVTSRSNSVDSIPPSTDVALAPPPPPEVSPEVASEVIAGLFPEVSPEASTMSANIPIATPAAAFSALMRTTAAAGELDEKTKTLINIALVALQRCGPCLTAHLGKARKLGITQAQIDEALWCAIAIGGACVKVFYDEWLQTDADSTPVQSKRSCC
jgi:selenide,water dikinase